VVKAVAKVAANALCCPTASSAGRWRERWIGLPVAQGQYFAIDAASIGSFGYATDHSQRRDISKSWSSSSSKIKAPTGSA